MPIDAQLINNLKPLVLPDVARQFAESQALGQERQLRAQQLESNAVGLEEKKKSISAGDELSRLLNQHSKPTTDGGLETDHGAVIQGLTAKGYGPEALKYDAQRRADLKSALDAQEQKVKLNGQKAERLGSLAGSVPQVDWTSPDAAVQATAAQQSLHRAMDQAKAEGLLDEAHVQALYNQPYTQAVEAQVRQFGAQAMKSAEQHTAHIADLNEVRAATDETFKAAKDKRDAAAAQREVELHPFKVAEETAKADQIARESAARANPDNPELQVAALNADQRMQLKERADMIAKLNTPAELAYKASDPKATSEARDAAKGALKILEQHAIASRPVTNNTIQIPGLGGGDSTLTGQDFLDQLEKTAPGTAAQVKAISEGRTALPPISSRGSGALIRDAVFKYEPQFSEQRAQVRKAFTSGPDGRNIGALNTAAVHLDQFADAADALKNGSFRPGNAVFNSLSQTFGNSAPTNFSGLKTAVAGELASALKGTATDQEIKSIGEAIEAKNSPEQLREYIKTQMHVLGAKLKTYQERYQQQIPGDTNYSPVLPSAKAAFEKHGIGATPKKPLSEIFK